MTKTKLTWHLFTPSISNKSYALFLMYTKGTRTSIADFRAPIEASLGLKI
jgi:hypothetical protein